MAESERLHQILRCHPSLSYNHCRGGPPGIHFNQVHNAEALVTLLEGPIPALAEGKLAKQDVKPLKLIVIDLFSELFDEDKFPKFRDLPYRARVLRKISSIAYQHASKFGLTVIFLGGTRETRARTPGGDTAPDRLRYSDQARWFARAHTLKNEDANEGVLGHVWPNQLNGRVMLSRTIRTVTRGEIARFLGRPDGRPVSAYEERPPLRRLSVIFSSSAVPASCDFVVLDEGVVGLPPTDQPPSPSYPPTTPPGSASVPSTSSGTNPSGTTTPISGFYTPVLSSGLQTPWSRQSLTYASDSSVQDRFSSVTGSEHTRLSVSSYRTALSTSFNGTSPTATLPPSTLASSSRGEVADDMMDIDNSLADPDNGTATAPRASSYDSNPDSDSDSEYWKYFPN